MTVNLLALCRRDAVFQLKRIVTTQPVQRKLEGMFVQQEASFLTGITDEVDFDGSWKPDEHELLRSALSAEMAAVWASSQQNILALDVLDAGRLTLENVRATLVAVGADGARRLLIQNFSMRQILNRSALAVVWDGNTFSEISQPAFALGSNLSAVMTATHLKFRSFNNVKMIFDLANVYEEASNAQIDSFSAHPSLDIGDLTAFKAIADQGLRKLVTAVTKKNVLNDYTPLQIQTAASATTLVVEVRNGKVVMPSTRSEAKKLMHFLDEGFYLGPLTGFPFITNSKKRA